MAKQFTVEYANSEYQGHSTVVSDQEAQARLAAAIRGAFNHPHRPWSLVEWTLNGAIMASAGCTMTITLTDLR